MNSNLYFAVIPAEFENIWIIVVISKFQNRRMAFPIPVYCQKRVIQRMNKTLGESKLSLAASQQKGKLGVVKKIIAICSIKQQIKNILLKWVNIGFKGITEESIDTILTYSKNILDNDKQKQLSQDLQTLFHSDFEDIRLLFKIIKDLVISPLQKSYITKIEKELKQDEQLDEEIKNIQAQLEEQKLMKLKDYDLHKSGVHSTPKAIKDTTTFKEVENFENKLMRANQKLNELSSNNTKLRHKINQLRKEKNAMGDIYTKLKKELESKKENVDKTIKFAGQAYCSRNKAEEDLRNLKYQSEQRKQQFKQECEKLNNEIQHDLRFKQFIKSKEIQREQLQKLEKEIQQNETTIEQKKQQNYKIDQEYKKSLEKQMQIKKAFQRIKKEIGFNDNNSQNKELLNIFINLYEKNIIMKDFVNEVTKEVEQLEAKIETKKDQIQKMYLKGTADEIDKRRLNQNVQDKFDFHERKKKILDVQYQKSVNTIQIIKKYIEDIFQEIGIDAIMIDKLKNSNLNEENLTQFLGELQKKGLQAISHYGKLVSEQLRAEKGGNWQIQKQIDELNNIITMENINTMNTRGPHRQTDYPSELLIKLKDDKVKEEQIDKALNIQQLKKYAIESLEQYQKRQLPKEKHLNRKYNIAPILMTSKSKKKEK